MGTAKVGAPEIYWIDHVAELQSLVSPNDPRWAEYDALLRANTNFIWVNTSDFCALAQPDYVVPTVDDFLDGSWKDKLVQCARAIAWDKNCDP